MWPSIWKQTQLLAFPYEVNNSVETTAEPCTCVRCLANVLTVPFWNKLIVCPQATPWYCSNQAKYPMCNCLQPQTKTWTILHFIYLFICSVAKIWTTTKKERENSGLMFSPQLTAEGCGFWNTPGCLTPPISCAFPCFSLEIHSASGPPPKMCLDKETLNVCNPSATSPLRHEELIDKLLHIVKDAQLQLKGCYLMLETERRCTLY